MKAPAEIQIAMYMSIQKAVKEHRETTGTKRPLYLVLNSKDFKRMRGIKGMKTRVQYYPTVPEGTFYLSETKPNPKDYE